ncbi:hypothetical protein LTR78_000404 [Recurvomyces mirabilis]|uniref:Uncharacterized protein n=1 Tax=Recurvomyces mirabilis TaxID=574656 RepID=A0AAE1C6J5_9PEZI|nr:hypothetical protein LTR78_000404 [Recurvomyces mirabilis]KAK5162059.1 hypothetical protein LTS14_000405 [Recurvomyces mirabilis]
MAADTKHVEALDQLQKEVNATLENIGRLFAAAQSGVKGSAAARALRLKRDMPESINRYHAALDILDDELQTAKAVMRRDLAVCRERSEIQPPKADTKSIGTTLKQVPGHAQDQKPIQASNSAPSEQAQDEEPGATETSLSTNLDESSASVQLSSKSADKEDPGTVDAKVKPITPPLPAEASPTLLPASPDDKKPTTADLSIDTNPPQPAKETASKEDYTDTTMTDQPDTAPTTATENADLESLFNDPASASASATAISAPGSGPATIASEAPDPDLTTGIDFGSFNASLSKPSTTNDHDLNLGRGEDADNDLSALLPGVQDYANMQPENPMEGLDMEMEMDMGIGMEQPNFDELFAADGDGPGDLMGGDGDGDGMAGVGDSTFDDLMDFSNFDNGGGRGGEEFGTGDGKDNHPEFDFGFS